MSQTFEYPNLLTGSRSGAGWSYDNGGMRYEALGRGFENKQHALLNSTKNENYIRSPYVLLKHGIAYAFSVYTANESNCAGSDIYVLYNQITDGWIAGEIIHCEKGRVGGEVTFMFTIPDTSPEGNYYIRFDNNGSTDGKDALIWFGSPMLCIASEPHAWAPAEGEVWP